jgi:DNA polymerase III sliding clamp (beta) subunit (PCNA family)
MLIVASAKDLAKAAATAAEMALHNSPYAILNNLLLTARDGEVSFSGSNLEGHMTVTCRAEETKPGSIAVDARIAKLLASFTDGALAKIVHADGITTLSCGRARYRIETLPAEDFPSAFDTNSVAELTLSDTERRRSFGVPAPAVSDEKMRFYLLGINLKVDTGQLVACATDGHILIKTSVTPGCELPDSLTCAPESYNKLKADISELEASISELESDIPDSEGDSGIGIANLKWKLADARKTQSQALSGVIVPKDACASIAKMDGCIIRLASNCIEAATASQRLVHKLIEGTFPDYKRVIPPPTGNTCKVDRKELLDAIND